MYASIYAKITSPLFSNLYFYLIDNLKCRHFSAIFQDATVD